MRKYAIIIGFATVCLLLTLNSCKKYDEGPYLSFKSREDRISNTWGIEKIYKNDEEIAVTQEEGWKWTFSKNGTISRRFYFMGILYIANGTWSLESADEEIHINLTSPLYNENSVWIITKLMEEQLWVKYADNGDNYELHLVPRN